MGSWPPQSGSAAGPFGIRRAAIFDKVGAEVAGDLQRLDEALTGLEWTLSHNPEMFPSVPGTTMRQATAEIAGKRVVVFYTVDAHDGCCTLHLLTVG